MAANRDDTTAVSPSPLRVFVLILLLAFAVEGAIMLVLPLLRPGRDGRAVDAALDATALTLALAPAIWWLAVRPLRQLFLARGALLRRLFDLQEQERARVARDLHDGIGQHLTALLVGLRAIDHCDDLAAARAQARELRELTLRAHEESRALARGLRPATLEALGLVSAIEQMCLDFERAHGVPTSFHAEHAPSNRLAPAAEVALYRIAQEALTNAARHAQASRVDVTLACDDRFVRLSVSDDGRGGAAPAAAGSHRAGGSGLSIMRERAEAIGASLRVAGQERGGTRVEVELPLGGSR